MGGLRGGGRWGVGREEGGGGWGGRRGVGREEDTFFIFLFWS